MNVIIKVINENEHRPHISGADWFFDSNGDLQVRVSKLSDWRREMCLAFHEAVEAVLCKHNGVSQQAVDDFDYQYDQDHSSDINAGDDPLAPYEHEHSLATAVERILAAELRVQWKEYDDELGRIPTPKQKRTGVRHLKSAGKPAKKPSAAHDQD